MNKRKWQQRVETQAKLQRERDRQIKLRETSDHTNAPSPDEIASGDDFSTWASDLSGLSVAANQSVDIWRQVSADTSEVQKAMARIAKDMLGSKDVYREGSFTWPTTKKKKITDVTIEVDYNPVSITRLDDPFPVQIPGQREIKVRDQDGDPVPSGLEEKLVKLCEDYKGVEDLGSKITQILAEWNSEGPEPMQQAPPGHRAGCTYRGSHHFACTCQPPTLWGKTLLWYCDCCGQPTAPAQYGLCAMCKAHEYSDGRQADADHEVALLYA